MVQHKIDEYNRQHLIEHQRKFDFVAGDMVELNATLQKPEAFQIAIHGQYLKISSD